jgi:hypothetical protein
MLLRLANHSPLFSWNIREIIVIAPPDLANESYVGVRPFKSAIALIGSFTRAIRITANL